MSDGSRQKLLIVDDDARVRRLLKQVLAGPGREFLEAGDGAEAVALHQAESPDLVIMDVEMEPMDGITATRLICERDAACTVVIITQHNEPHFRAAALEAGARAFVLKDDLSEFDDIISRFSSPRSPAP